MATGPQRRRGAQEAPRAGAVDERVLDRYARVSLHFRTYLPIYVLATVWVVILGLFPTMNRGTEVRAGGLGGAAESGDFAADFQGGDSGDLEAFGEGTVAAGAEGGDGEGTGGPGGGAGGGPGAGGGAAVDAGGGGSTAAGAAGPMRDGRDCEPGVRQVEGSSYAAPCRPVHAGANGGATARGVTDDTIRIVRRTFPDSANSQAVALFAQQAGAASADVTHQVRQTWIAYFNEVFELYGRRVELIDYVSRHGNSTEEAQSKGREGACLDAEQIVQELNAFGTLGGGSSPFAECAAQRGLMVFDAAAYFPESFYRRHSPYLWNTTPSCTQLSELVSEYIGKRLLNRPARWAGDPAYRDRPRKFGTYVPNNDAYQSCTNNSERLIREKYGAAETVRYNYTLDVSRFPDEAARAVVQFRREGVTTLILACDPISITFLTQSANTQNWGPEWLLIGTALQDVDNTGRLYEQSQVDGHMFGMGVVGDADDIAGPRSEPGQIYERVTGRQMPEGTAGGYFDVTHMYNLLQAAGPQLTPENVRRGAFSLPPAGGPAAGRWNFAVGPDGNPDDVKHTAISDAREIYWAGSERDADGDLGVFRATYDGRRFTNGEWPAEEPRVYPGR